MTYNQEMMMKMIGVLAIRIHGSQAASQNKRYFTCLGQGHKQTNQQINIDTQNNRNKITK